jgi:hypothetical protein
VGTKTYPTNPTRREWGMIDWFYLPYRPVIKKWERIKVYTAKDGTHAARMEPLNTPKWGMSNDLLDVMSLLCQIELSQGRVFVAGLGLGLTTLLVANKPEVSEVVVSEVEQETIDFFMGQGFNLDKIKILNESWETHISEKPYDWVLLDHYDGHDAIPAIPKQLNKFFNNNNCTPQVLFYLWEQFYKSSYSDTPFEEYCSQFKLPSFTPAQKQRYLIDKVEGSINIPEIVDALKQIHARRTRSA